MNINVDSLKEYTKSDITWDMKCLKENIKGDMEGLKEDLTKLLREMIPSGDKVFHETHDENKRNVNHNFRDFNFGWKTTHIPNINIQESCGNDMVTRILHID